MNLAVKIMKIFIRFCTYKTTVFIYRRYKVKHVLIQPPDKDSVCKAVLKKHLFEEGIHCCIIVMHLEDFIACFV